MPMLVDPARVVWSEELLRLGAAVLAGGALGLDRNLRGKWAGLRTHALVSMGAALVMVTTAHLTTQDPGAATRTVQGVITGIGFVGAGVILHLRDERTGRARVRGLTTAASVWVAAALGTASGMGLWSLVLIATLLTLLVLAFGGPLEDAARGRLARRRAALPGADARAHERPMGERRRSPPPGEPAISAADPPPAPPPPPPSPRRG